MQVLLEIRDNMVDESEGVELIHVGRAPEDIEKEIRDRFAAKKETPEQRAKRPPAVHPVLLTHPVTGGAVLYCNPGYAERILELDEAESELMLERLFAHQLQPEYQWAHHCTAGDVLIWDHLGTLHNAIPDYGPGEHRLMLRCQVMAETVFDPAFRRQWLQAA